MSREEKKLFEDNFRVIFHAATAKKIVFNFHFAIDFPFLETSTDLNNFFIA